MNYIDSEMSPIIHGFCILTYIIPYTKLLIQLRAVNSP
jgi:hypothetical protein